jgi:hypothetical protein
MLVCQSTTAVIYVTTITLVFNSLALTQVGPAPTRLRYCWSAHLLHPK